MTDNRKIINATEVNLNGLSFRSKLEARVYKELLRLGYSPSYESYSCILLDGFVPSKPWFNDGVPEVTVKDVPKSVREWRYTPDFIIRKGGLTAYIECKGYSNDLHPYKRKVFLKVINNDRVNYYFEVRTLRGLRKSMEEFEKLIIKHRKNNEESL